MAGYTLAQAQAHLDAALAAELAIYNSQQYAIGGRSLVRAPLEAVGKRIEKWEAVVDKLDRGGIKVVGGTPC